MKTNFLALVSTRNLFLAWPQLAAALWLTLTLPAVATSLQLNFTVPSSFNESNRQAVLEWNAAPARTYLVQSATNLSPETAWKTEAPVRAATNGPIKWMAPEALGAQKYYRLILPQPDVFSVEPAFVNSDDPGALFYLIGQMLPTNGSVVINGQNFSVTSFDTNGSWVALSLAGLPPGTPIIGNILVLDNASNLVTTLPLQNPVIFGTELTAEQLQGPPEEPPASPVTYIVEELEFAVEKVERAKSAARGHVTVLKAADDDDDSAPAFLSKKGYDYYQAQSQLNSASLHNNPYFQGNAMGGAMPLSKKGYDYYQAQSASALKVQEGKKGLNAVNVKLAYSSGELLSEETDLTIPGRGLDFAWTRTYRSRAETTTAQGAGWDFSYNVSVTSQPDGTVVLRPGNGRADTFYPDGTNGWTRDEYFLACLDSNGDGSVDVASFADGGKWLFHPPGTAFAGKLAQIVDRNNNTIRCEYDTDTGRLLRVVDTLDRTNTVAYTSKGLIESITDFSGRTVRYEYDSAADLIACISPAVIGTPNGNDFPGGKTNRYAYSTGNLDQRLNHNLVSITDPKGQVCLEVTYQATNDPAALDFDAVSSVLRGIDKKDIRRGMVIARPSNSFATVQTIINDYVGNVTEYLFDSRHRCVSVREFTGRANPTLPTTATENRPTGKLRAGDPDYFETRWEWNADSLCTQETRPDGGSTEISHQRAQDHNSTRSNKTASRAHDGNVRVVRERASSPVDMDGDGTPDTTDLAWHLEHDPRFGSPPANAREIKIKHKGWDGLIYGNHRIRPRGWDGTIKGRSASVESARIIMDRDSGRSKGFGFITSAIDPRGMVSAAAYDANGNCTKSIKQGHYAVSNFHIEVDGLYNSHGQLTAITNASDANGNRRVDTFSYYDTGAQRGMVEVMMAIGISGGLSLATAFEYDDRGNVTRVVDPRGNDLLFTYNALDQCVTRQTQQSSFGERVKTVFHYDANDNVVRCDLENRDDTGALVAANPQWTALFEHDALDRLSGIVQEISEGGGLPGSYATNRFVYDANDNLTEIRSPLAVSGTDLHNTVAFEYDERDLLFREIGAPGSPEQRTAQCDYDANGNVIRVSEGLEGVPSITTFAYDGFAGGGSSLKKVLGTFTLVGCGLKRFDWAPKLEGGKEGLAVAKKMMGAPKIGEATARCSSSTDPLGNITTFHYDANDNLKVVRHFGETNDVPGSAGNRLLSETRYTYDSLDRCVRQVDSFFDISTQLPVGDGQATTTFSYAPNGACTSVMDDNAHSTRFIYDALGRLAAVTDPKTNVVQFTYDACDNLISMVSSARSEVNQALQQFSIAHTYDALNRCVSSVDNVGNTNRYAYDSRGNPVSQFDPRENETFAVFDGLGRCVATTNYVGKERGITINTSHVEYDTNSRRTAATDSNGNTTTYAHDSLDRLVQVIEADGTTSSLVWSPRSNLLRKQDANGTVITNVYDLADRCISRTIVPGPTVAATTTFETFAYDGFSRCVAATNDVSGSTFAYDSLGNCVRQVQDGLQTTSSFDGAGNCLSQTYPGGRVVAYTYDALDQPTSLSSSAGGGLPPTVLAQLAYDGPGRLGRLTRANNVNTRYQWNGLVNPPNGPEDFGWMQVRGINHQAAGNGPIVDQRIATYDRSQNRTLRAQVAPFVLGGDTLTNSFDYDALDRLRLAIKTKGTSAQRVDYSLDGNGNRLSVAVDLVPEPYLMDNTFPDPADFQMNQYTLTPVGAFQYDARGNRVARATPSAALQYQYDYADRLVAVTDLSSGLPELVSAYGYDALGRRLSRTLFSSGLPPVTTQFVYDGGCTIEERDNGTLKRTYAFPHVFDQKGRIMFTDLGETFYCHDDELGNTLALTDASGGVVERYEYDDYGNPFFLTADGLPTGETESGVGNPYCWRGLRFDAESGLYNNDGGGYFDPHTARPIGLPKVTPKIAKESHGKFRTSNNPWSGGSPVEMKKGTVKFFNEAKGFGFVADGSVNVKLIVPIAMDKGLRFAVRGGSASGTRAQDHNSSRSNKTSSIVAGGGDPGDLVVKFVVKK